MAKSTTKSTSTRQKGRPTRYSKRLGDQICTKIAEGNSLRSICADSKMPDKSTVFRWMRLPSLSTFRDQYARACQDRADAYAEDLNGIAEDAIQAVLDHQDEPKVGSALVQAYKLKGDNLKWTMSRMQPKKYGDKVDVTSGDEPIQPLKLFSMRPADLVKKKG